MYMLETEYKGKEISYETFKTKKQARIFAKNHCESLYKGILKWNTGNSIEYGKLKYIIKLI